MSQPSNGSRPRRSAARRRQREVETLAVLARLGRSDRDLLAALVTIVRYGDLETLRAARAIAGLTLRVAQRRAPRDANPMTPGPWRPW
jgi:hypothetical protein